MDDNIIIEARRLSPHDLKRKGMTAPGTKTAKQDAAGLSEEIKKVYETLVYSFDSASSFRRLFRTKVG